MNSNGPADIFKRLLLRLPARPDGVAHVAGSSFAPAQHPTLSLQKSRTCSNPREDIAKSRFALWILSAVLIGGLGFLVWFSFHLASVRILQVDECGNVFAARYLAQGQAAKLNGSIDLFQLLLSPLARGPSRAMDFFINARFLMLEVFWLNIFLITLATGVRLFSLRGLVALAGAASLAPLWDYGFEVRHDNLVLAAVLLTWCNLRQTTKLGPQSYFVAGALVIIAQFLAAKSFVYTLPISIAILLFPPPWARGARWKLWLAWLAGGAISFGILFCLYRSKGLWQGYINGGRSMSALATGNSRFAPWSTLARLLTQTPLLLGLLPAALVGCLGGLIRHRRSALSWESCLPEAGLFTVSLGVLFVNPTPYPYNLLHVTPYAFLLAWRWCVCQWDNAANPWRLLPVIASVIFFAHIVPFAIATRRHTQWPNYRQEKLTRLAEDLTDPNKDPVYDAIGLVLTRPFVDRRAFLHGLLINNFLKGSSLRLRDMLAANPPAVLIPSYRTDWLPDEDHDFIRDRYVSLADDFLVLGKVLPAGGGTFEVFHSGRYRVSTLKGSDLAGTYPLGLKGMMTPEDHGTITGLLDGISLTAQPVQLAEGVHRIECARDCQPAIVWMGPRLERIHRIGPGDHQLLFYNWY